MLKIDLNFFIYFKLVIMVKNVKGGNKHKKMARKQFGEPVEEKIRYSSCEDEIYGSVAKIYGNGRILVTCNDNIERLCVIRKKFKGRNKRNNEINIGAYILIGKRSWNSNIEGKLETTDLLYVYSSQQANKLKYQNVINQKVLSVNERNVEEDKQPQENTYFYDEEKLEDEENIVEFKEDEEKDKPYFEFNYSSSEEEEENKEEEEELE
jgi:initiation factor 1A